MGERAIGRARTGNVKAGEYSEMKVITNSRGRYIEYIEELPTKRFVVLRAASFIG